MVHLLKKLDFTKDFKYWKTVIQFLICWSKVICFDFETCFADLLFSSFDQLAFKVLGVPLNKIVTVFPIFSPSFKVIFDVVSSILTTLFLFNLAADCFTYMKGGTEFLKLRPGGRQYQRFYQLDQDMDLLHWRPSSKKPEKAMCKCFTVNSHDSFSVILKYCYFLNVDDTIKKSHCKSMAKIHSCFLNITFYNFRWLFCWNHELKQSITILKSSKCE